MSAKNQAKIYRQNKNKRNRIFLLSFIVFILIALTIKIVCGILYDIGFYQNKVHIGFWSEPSKAFAEEWENWALQLGGTIDQKGFTFQDFVSAENNAELRNIINYRPSSLWFWTQFTWLTTIIIIIFLFFRILDVDHAKLPKWLAWINTQKTLSLVTMYDLIVALLFWGAIIFSLNGANMNAQNTGYFQIFYLESIASVAVHAVIPLTLLTYSIIFLLHSKEAKPLQDIFAFKVMIYPALYVAFYIILTIIWYDPYPITNMHERLTNNNFQNGIIPNWKSWSEQLWIAPAILGVIYLLIFSMSFVHNLILKKFNKHYQEKKLNFQKIKL